MSSSSSYAVKIEGLGKRYLVPQTDETGRAARLRAHLKEYLPFTRHEDDDYFWALRDLDLEVKPGEVLGIVGKNGSGKSTLLKILTGVTDPTEGRATLRGRVASLLEVGTGFHPDLTGRENVFMAGVLLGIKHAEIRAKFDQIVDFSGIETFIDVPVKRYSSGMYVRLAYAVASMLRSDILILDEVMSVGDAGFREKSQANIENMAKDGRTILFVSHNPRAVTSICTRGIILDAGRCVFQGEARDAVAKYLRDVHQYDEPNGDGSEDPVIHDVADAPRLFPGRAVIRWVSTHAADGTPTKRFKTGSSVVVRIGYEGATASDPYFSVLLMNEFAERVATIHSTHVLGAARYPVSGIVECRIDDLRLGDGKYNLMIDYGNFGGSRLAETTMDCVPNAGEIDVEVSGFVQGHGASSYEGAVHRSSWRCLEPIEGNSVQEA